MPWTAFYTISSSKLAIKFRTRISLPTIYRPPPEPAHFLQSVGSSLVYATTGNRVGVYADVANSHALNTVTKLRSETFRGVLTSLAVLPLNRAFLAGNESGNIVLLC